MKIGYARISKADGSQMLDMQIDCLIQAGVTTENIYTDTLSGSIDDRPGLISCLKALRGGDMLVLWKLDRLGRNLRHLIDTVDDLGKRGIGIKTLSGQAVDTSTNEGKLFFRIFASLAEYERDLIRERTRAGLRAARARGRVGGRPHSMTKNKLLVAASAMKSSSTSVKELCAELGITKPTLYRYVSPEGEIREVGNRLLKNQKVNK